MIRKPPRNPIRSPKRFSAAAIIGLVLVLAATTYAPVRNYPFVSFDDPTYVSENPRIAAGLTPVAVGQAFTSTHAGYWIPLTWLSYMVDVEVAGNVDARTHHVTNVVLHLANTLLLFGFLNRHTGEAGRSALVAGLFALHPLHVESVAWVTERKDVLSTMFLFLALHAYGNHVRTHSARSYAAVVACFAAGLMAKPMLVTFPLLLLLVDAWPLARFEGGLPADTSDAGKRLRRRLIVEKIPLLGLALASGVVTYVAQHGAGATADFASVGPLIRLTNALVSSVAYLGKMVWPARLAVFYPFPASAEVGPALAALLFLVVMSAWAVRRLRTRPAVAVGWFWYLLALLPVIGLIQVGNQGMADRFTYVPLVGVYIAVAWGVPAIPRFGRFVAPALGVAMLLALAATTSAQLETWRSDTALWNHALAVAPRNFLAHDFLGRSLVDQGRQAEAMPHFVESVRLNPRFADARDNLGLALASEGRFEEAIGEYQAALGLRRNAGTLNNLGVALAGQGRLDDALAAGLEALQLEPASPAAHYNVGSTLLRLGRLDQALEQYREALLLTPDFAAAQAAVGEVLALQGHWEPAIAALESALSMDAKIVGARYRLGQLLTSQNRLHEAIGEYEEALRLDPRRADIHSDLGFALGAAGRPLDAIPHFVEALTIEPRSATTHYYLGLALAGTRRYQESAVHFAEALRLDPRLADAQRALDALPRRGRQ